MCNSWENFLQEADVLLNTELNFHMPCECPDVICTLTHVLYIHVYLMLVWFSNILCFVLIERYSYSPNSLINSTMAGARPGINPNPRMETSIPHEWQQPSDLNHHCCLQYLLGIWDPQLEPKLEPKWDKNTSSLSKCSLQILFYY